MLSTSDERTRLLRVTRGNLRNAHLYVSEHLDFFPPDIVGPSKDPGSPNGRAIQIHLDGLNVVVETDIGSDPKSGRARRMFRRRDWVRRFFEHHGVAEGEVIAIEHQGSRAYRLSVFRPPVLTVAEFFAGIGLVRLALERQRCRVLFANDIDPRKAEMYRHNWPDDAHLLVGDIHRLHPSEIPGCNLFTASFPCNDLSIAGRWEGLNGKESSAFWGFISILNALRSRRPQLVLLENVVGFLMSHKGRDFEQAMLALNDLGYTTDAVILNAAHWTPQSRARLFVVGRLDDGRPRQTIAPVSDCRPDALASFINTFRHIRWDIRELPSLPKRTSQLADVLERLPDGDHHWWTKERARYFLSQLSDKHRVAADAMIAGHRYTYATAFRRVRNGRSMAELRTDGIAGCLRTPRGGSGRQILFKAGRGKFRVRLLTARECARLQGVPDSYRIEVPLNQALFGFGDAVCVPAVEWIAANCLIPAVRHTL